ncbi:hypothetical protein [Clostridium sp.]|uniref:hypothetical protein n=1 Tax=Clostridium sp. TaxID=1506 RepID=UPI002608CBEC|nr:hypothetical protein [Clostridium sp.]
MECNESNFIYLKKTSVEKYYEELVRAEHLCEYFPAITKIIIRKVLEALLKNIAEKHKIESNTSAWNLLNNIELSTSFSFPEEIINYIETVLVNGYEHASRNNRNRKISKHPIEILEIMHNILCWYLRKTEGQKIKSLKNLSFKAPSTIEYMQKEISKVKGDISLKDKQINNLRQKIIEVSSQSKAIGELNNIIIEIKKEKSYLEETKILLTKKIEVQKNQVAQVENDYKFYMKKLDKLKQRCNENQELLFEKESQLVKAEIKNQELKDLIKNLEEQDNKIEDNEHYLEEELKKVRQAYEKLVKLTNQYQDILETVEFSYSSDLQKSLEAQKNNITMEINFQNTVFNENIIDYNKNMAEVKRKVLIFKEILNEKIKRGIKYKSLYKGFLRLEGKELRIIYTIINNSNTAPSFINKSKELFLKSNEEKFLSLLNKNLEDLKNISDDEIKLLLYYKLIKLSQVPLGSIYNRKQFIKALENMVDKAYEILESKKDFKGGIKKLDAIIRYYLDKIISSLKNKNINLHISEELTDKIYGKIIELKQNEENIIKEKIYYDKFNLDNMSEVMFKSSIKSQPFIFISIMVDLSNSTSYQEISAIIFEVESLISNRTLSKAYEGGVLNSKLLNEYFMVLLFLYSGAASINQNQQMELLPLLVLEIISIDLIENNDEANLESYTRMIESWKRKQQKYNDIFMEKEEMESSLEFLLEESQRVEFIIKQLSESSNLLVQRYENYKEEFKSIILNSEKRILLPSYMNYDELRSKKEIAENNINNSKNKHGTLKNMFSLELWKEQANKLVNESNMIEVENKLIEEAKQKPYFKKEYSVFAEIENEIQKTNELVNKNKEELKNKNLLTGNMKNKITELEKQLTTIKDAYPDIEEGYY